jgi:4-hydroxythreonine-4-phosphate dehydrogenase
LQGEFDVVVALYHDQGLAPLKTLEFDQSVNLTLGLPFLRTSPDHGTAYALAGKGIAKLSSWENAVRLARGALATTASGANGKDSPFTF